MAKRKNILIIATGGTIASMEEGRGLAPALTGAELVGYVPEINDVCDFQIVQPMNIDSTNMRPRDWLRIAATIRECYADFDGFVVLHGTDTMAYTAAALSYLVQDSPKPIVLTGSQRPMANPFTDAKVNLYHSLLYACDDLSRDVSVVFGGQVIAGTRARKQRTMSDNAFISLNFPAVALIRNNRIIRAGVFPGGGGSGASIPVMGEGGETGGKLPEYRARRRARAEARLAARLAAGRSAFRRRRDEGFRARSGDVACCDGHGGMEVASAEDLSARHSGDNPPFSTDSLVPHPGGLDVSGSPRFFDTLNERVFVLKLTPEMDPSIFEVLSAKYDAVIVETFGIGGIPEYDNASYKRAIFDWVDGGRTLVLTTQVPEEGLDLGVYEVGRDFAQHPGILQGGDMSTEALVAKTMWALGQTRDAERVAELFYRPVNNDRIPEA